MSAPERPEPPEYLSEAAKSWFTEISGTWDLGPDGLTQLEVTAAALDRLWQAQEILAKEGIVVETRNGMRSHPCIAVERDSRLAVLRGLRELNLEGSDPMPPPRMPRGRGRSS